MSMASDVRCTALYFCIENDIPQDKAIALLNELVEDMDGDPDNYNFCEWVASEYARLQKSRPTPLAPDACPYCLGKGKEPANGVLVSCRFCAGTGKRG